MAGSPDRGSADTPGGRRHLRTVPAATFVAVAVAVLLTMVARAVPPRRKWLLRNRARPQQ